MKQLSLLMAVLQTFGCGLKPTQKPAKPGVYTIATVHHQNFGSVVTIKGLKGSYWLPTDTLTPGKTISITFLHRQR
jgi:hypothetical protein